MNSINRILLASLTAWAGVSTQLSATTINFDDGLAGQPIGSYYPGVTFSANAIWAGSLGLPGTSSPLGVGNSAGGWIYEFPTASPVVVTFASLQNQVSITASDVGERGVTLKAYDAAHNLVAQDTQYGTDLGIGIYFELNTVAPLIKEIAFSQAIDSSLGEGVVFDNLKYSGTAPDGGTSLTLLGVGLLGLAGLRRRV